MKKVLSVAMASAMVLGMGANAFAIQYSTGSNDTAAWPKGFQFEGSLFVTDKDGNIVESTLTDLNGKTRVNFNEGDVIWMPLYADNQKQYTVKGDQAGMDEVAATTINLKPTLNVANEGEVQIDAAGNIMGGFTYTDNVNKVVYYYNTVKPTVGEGWRVAQIAANGVKLNRTTDLVETVVTTTNVQGALALKATGSAGNYTFTLNNGSTVTNTSPAVATVATDWYDRVNNDSSSLAEEGATTISVDYNWIIANTDPTDIVTTGTEFTTRTVNAGTAPVSKTAIKSDVVVTVSLPKVEAVKEDLGDVVDQNGENSNNQFVNTVAHGHYTGNIDKNWSINLIEEDNGVADLIEKAELYKADEVDYLSYSKYTNEIMPNAVYLKVTLKDTWKLAKAVDMKYYVYVADNKSNKNVTNKVWVSGKYEASDIRTVDFTWTNDASKPAVWKVKDGENGIAVFDFADKAFFQVKMYAGESMYLDLSTAYNQAISGDFDEADAFFYFDNENANFSRTGTLILVSDDETLVPYQVTEDGYTKVDAEYVKDFAIAHTNEKVDGFVFETKELGNYVLATEEVAEEEDNTDNNQEVVVPDTDDNNETNNNSKPNPSTGAEDFVGLAVSLAVVSVAAAGALALKK